MPKAKKLASKPEKRDKPVAPARFVPVRDRKLKICSITPIWNNEQFIQGHLGMMQDLDEQIVIMGTEPFPEYAKVYGVSDTPDRSLERIQKMYPHVHVLPAPTNHFGADLLNPAVELAAELGCDYVLKLDADMLMDADNWQRMKNFLYSDDIREVEAVRLNYRKNTQCYYRDTEHGIPCEAVGKGAGNDIVALSTQDRFVGNLGFNGSTERTIDWDGFVVHHFVGFKPNVDAEWLRLFCQEKGISEGDFTEAPEEIMEMLRYQ